MLHHKAGRTRGQLEADIASAITQFEKEYMGRGPTETKAYILEDMVIVRLKGVLTKAEASLVKSDRGGKSRELLKQMRIELIEHARSELESLIKGIIRHKVVSLHTDLSTVTGERVIVFIIDKKILVDGGDSADGDADDVRGDEK